MSALIHSIKLLAIATLTLASTHLAQAQDIELLPSGPIAFDEGTGEVVFTEGAQIVYGDWLLYAETIRYNQKTGEANASGNVVFSRFDLRLIADSLTYRPTEQYIKVNNFRAGNGRAYVDGSVLEGNPNDFKFNDVNFYPGEPGTFLFEARAGEIALIDQNEIRGKKLFFKVGPIPFLLIPNITQPLDTETNLFKPTLDYSGHIGASIGAEMLAPVGDHLRLGGNIALTTKRGVLAGPAARYSAENEKYEVTGNFISGYIKDQGDPGADILGDVIDDHRYFAEWQHQQIWSGNRANLSTYMRYWSDSEVTRDFRESSFDRVQDPDSYLEANYNGDNWQLALFTRVKLNEFQRFTERLPELKFTLFPTTITKGLTHQGFISAARLDGGANLFGEANGATRLDAYYGWNYNKTLRDGVTFGLKAGARGIRYENAKALNGYPFIGTPSANYPGFNSDDLSIIEFEGQQVLGELGAHIAFKAYSEHEFKNKTWDITGIRHIVEPIITYRYTPQIENSYQLNRPIYDNTGFSNFLNPINIENRQDTDALREGHRLRLEVKNRIQTRHRNSSSRDLARFTIANDLYLSQSITNPQYNSLIYSDFQLTPADWIEARLYTRLDPEDGFKFKEANARLTIQDKGYWKIGVGTHFLDTYDPPVTAYGYTVLNPSRSPNELYTRRLEQYYGLIEYNLNENLKLYATARYDSDSGVFYEQRIGLMQRALERYGLKYELRFYDGNRRESDFGISIGIDLFDE